MLLRPLPSQLSIAYPASRPFATALYMRMRDSIAPPSPPSVAARFVT
jgi:hypothetical protein